MSYRSLSRLNTAQYTWETDQLFKSSHHRSDCSFLVIGGGSGHEPMYSGFVGPGLGARCGCAKSLMERSIGYPDAGAASVWIIFRSMREYVEDSCEK